MVLLSDAPSNCPCAWIWYQSLFVEATDEDVEERRAAEMIVNISSNNNSNQDEASSKCSRMLMGLIRQIQAWIPPSRCTPRRQICMQLLSSPSSVRAVERQHEFCCNDNGSWPALSSDILSQVGQWTIAHASSKAKDNVYITQIHVGIVKRSTNQFNGSHG